MSLPPERISIKRRRQDDPVDTLYLEIGSNRDSKRRFTDFCFQRLQQNPAISRSTSPELAVDARRQRASSSEATKNVIPVVRATLPGDEISETLRLKAANREKQTAGVVQGPAQIESRPVSNGADEASSSETEIPKDSSEGRLQKAASKARRFHLTREASPAQTTMEYSGVRKRKASRKSHVAIFVEKLSATPTSRRHSMLKNSSSDKMVEILGAHSSENGSSLIKDDKMDVSPEPPNMSKETTVPSFVQPQNSRMKTGKSIQDPPSTWDLSSDQLADELAALALEFDSEESPRDDHKSEEIIADSNLNSRISSDDDDFIYDTYLRLPIGQDASQIQGKDKISDGVGVLVIDEDNDDLWQSYIESDDDTDWDEEDADSNAEDNPANDYPEDELSSGDEFGYDSYKYHKDVSDEEGDDLEDKYN